jgi:ribosome-associated translation inhibitor RaiA
VDKLDRQILKHKEKNIDHRYHSNGGSKGQEAEQA